MLDLRFGQHLDEILIHLSVNSGCHTFQCLRSMQSTIAIGSIQTLTFSVHNLVFQCLLLALSMCCSRPRRCRPYARHRCLLPILPPRASCSTLGASCFAIAYAPRTPPPMLLPALPPAPLGRRHRYRATHYFVVPLPPSFAEKNVVTPPSTKKGLDEVQHSVIPISTFSYSNFDILLLQSSNPIKKLVEYVH